MAQSDGAVRSDAQGAERPESGTSPSVTPSPRPSAVWRRGARERDPTLGFTPVALPALAETARCEATLLFADLFGYSAFTEERDIEQVAAVVGAIKQEAMRIVHAHGGIVNQFVGDEIMALFGFPKGRQDAPRRAIDAALELHAFVRSADLRQWLGPERQLRLHSGIDAGVVLMRTHDVRNGLFELTGGAVNRAARLRSLAAADELLVSQRVHARTAPFFCAEQRLQEGAASPDESTTPYRILSRRDSAPPTPTHAPSRLPARSELAELQRFWAERSPRTGGLVVVQGAAGSGKSRLLASFAVQLAREGASTWSVQCRDDDCQPFSALSQLVATVQAPATTHPENPLSALGSQLQQATQGIGMAQRDPQAYTAFIKTAADLVAGHVESSGLTHAFLIDDVQWLDPSSRAVLTHLGERLFPQGHIFVCAGRDDERSREALERFRNPLHTDQSATIQLGPLSAEDASGMLNEYLGPQHGRAPEILAQLTSLSDGTPLSLLELLELLLENKYIQAREGTWQLDPDSLRFMQLSASARALIQRRIAQLAPDTVDVLQAAAIMRGRIDLALLSQVVGRDPDQVQAALDDAALARMIELDTSGTPRFAHDTIWEVLLAGMSEDQQRGLHQQVVRVLRGRRTTNQTCTFELARHCAAGRLEDDPRGAFQTLLEAARLARTACDDALALTFLKPAELAAELGSFDPGASFFAELAESSLRVGELDAAFSSFRAAAERTSAGFERAHLLGRMAWIRHHQAQGTHAFQMLQEALHECSRSFARSPGSALSHALALHARRVLVRREDSLTRRETEILCGIYGELARVCAESSQNLLSLAAWLYLDDAASALPRCRERVRADAVCAFFLLVAGARARSRRVFERALASAEQLHDPQAIAYCHQIGHVLAAWQGDMKASAEHTQKALVKGGQYLELGDLCMLVLSMYSIESYRGHVDAALAWLEHAIVRVREAGHAPAVFALVEEAASCALVSSGRQEGIVHMKSRLRFVKRSESPRTGLQEQVAFQFRVQYVIERDEPGAELEQLIADFERHQLNPKSVHLNVVIFYVQVAHARVHQCLRASAEQRPHFVAKLRRALVDVKASTRLPLMYAHTHVLRAAEAYFSGGVARSEQLLCAAEKVARDEDIPWVSYAAARLRAHILRAQGKQEASLDQARVAALYARQHGQLGRLRFIRDEFELDDV
jgi:class 3 adenylate cyclase/tetratricopeptide (TPR) repeat protein